jgi:hypothetical protein
LSLQARYLVLLREPVSRVISHFNMRIQGQSLLEGVAPGNYSSGWVEYIASEVERWVRQQQQSQHIDCCSFVSEQYRACRDQRKT